MSNHKNKLFVSSLPGNTPKEEIINYFSKFGEIKSSSAIFRIGSKAVKCIVIEFTSSEPKSVILERAHCLNGRYLDCKHYMRGTKLKARINKLQKVNVYLPMVPENLDPQYLKNELGKFGKIEAVKLGFSIKENSHYSIVTFEEESSAQNALNAKSFILSGIEIPIRGYKKGKQSEGKENKGKNVNNLDRSQHLQNFNFQQHPNFNVFSGKNKRSQHYSDFRNEENFYHRNEIMPSSLSNRRERRIHYPLVDYEYQQEMKYENYGVYQEEPFNYGNFKEDYQRRPRSSEYNHLNSEFDYGRNYGQEEELEPSFSYGRQKYHYQFNHNQGRYPNNYEEQSSEMMEEYDSPAYSQSERYNNHKRKQGSHILSQKLSQHHFEEGSSMDGSRNSQIFAPSKSSCSDALKMIAKKSHRVGQFHHQANIRENRIF